MHNSVRPQRGRGAAARDRRCFGAILTFLLLVTCPTVFAQTHSYPKEIRGYKVERTVIELKKSDRPITNASSSGERPRRVGTTIENGADANRNDPTADPKVDELIQFGKAKVASVTPLGISLEIPIVVASVQQKGRVDFLVFEDMVINDTPVEIAEYRHSFDLPNRGALTLR